MQAFKLVKQHTNRFNDIAESFIGDGADGDVYTIKNDPNKVIKFSVYYIWDNEDLKKIVYSKLSNFREVQLNPSIFAKLYEYSFIAEGKRKIVDGEQDYLLFSCIMEKCFPISEDEMKVFHSILSHEDNNIEKNFSIQKIENMLKGMSIGLDFSHIKIMNFIKKIRSNNIKHTDAHPRNIMKDNLGNFKFIDFDRLKKIDHDLQINYT